jgi:hypothetical protein
MRWWLAAADGAAPTARSFAALECVGLEMCAAGNASRRGHGAERDTAGEYDTPALSTGGDGDSTVAAHLPFTEETHGRQPALDPPS